MPRLTAAVGVPGEQRNILRKALFSIISPSVLSSDPAAALTSLFFAAHHPLLVKARDTSACWKSLVVKLGFADINAVNSQYGDSFLENLFSKSGLRSVDQFERGSAIYATTTLLQGSDAIPVKVLDSLSALLDPTPFVSLTRDERGVAVTPVGKVFRPPQLKEYIPEFTMEKNVKSDDDAVEAKRKLDAARRRHFLMVEEKLGKVYAEQLSSEQKVRERVLPIYTTLRTAIEAVIVASHHSACVSAFASRESVFVFKAVDLLYELMYFQPHQNDLAALASRALSVLAAHVLPVSLRQKVWQCLATVTPATPAPRLFVARTPSSAPAKKSASVSLATSSANATNKQREEDENTLAEKRAARALIESSLVDQVVSSGMHMEPSVWALLQVVFGSVFTPIHPVEIQERSVAQFQRHLPWVNQRFINTLVNVLEHAPFVADDARSALEDALTSHLTPFKPLHFSAIPSLVKHASVHPKAEVRRAVLKALRLVRSDRLRSFGQLDIVIPHLWLAKFETADAAEESSKLAAQIYEGSAPRQDFSGLLFPRLTGLSHARFSGPRPWRNHD